MTELNQNIDFEIIWKKIHNQTTDEEEILLNQWLELHPSHRKYFKDAIRYYANGTQFSNSPAEIENALKNIYRKSSIRSPRRNTRIVAIASIAASILFLIYFQFLNQDKSDVIKLVEQAETIVPGTNKAVLILADGSEHDLTSGNNSIIATDGAEIRNTGNKLEYLSNSSKAVELKYNILKIPRGGEYFLVLSDSTKVWLNSETTLRFPVHFAEGIRNVELTGEAYFEVSKNVNAPFIVSTINQKVKVLGTQFNISSYPNDKFTYTTLVEGKVEVLAGSNQEQKIILVPSEQSVLGNGNNQIMKRIVDVKQYVAWKDGRFVFQNQMLEDITNTLSKWYNVQFIFSREDLKNVRFTGNLQRYTDFSNILEKIERTNEVKFKIENNTITIE